jgi:phosphoribosylaminoimidazole-succinocarboxamide synthase
VAMETPKLLAATYTEEVFEVPNEADQLLEVKTDRLSLDGWPIARPVPGLGRARTAVAATVFEFLSTKFATHAIGVSDSFDGRGSLVKWSEPVPIAIRVEGYSLRYQGDGDDLGTGIVVDDKHSVPVIVPERLRADGVSERVTAQEVAGMINETLFAQMKMSALLLFRELDAWLKTSGVLLASTRLKFGVTGSDLLLVGEPAGVLGSVIALETDGAQRWIGGTVYEQRLSSLAQRKLVGHPDVMEQLAGRILDDHIRLLERLSNESLQSWPEDGTLYVGTKPVRRRFSMRPSGRW